LVERFHGKEEVPGSIPGNGSRKKRPPGTCIVPRGVLFSG